MELSPRLVPTHVPRDPEAVALVLHGGASRGDRVAVSPTQLSVLRMVPVARRLARAGRGRLAVFRVLNSVRGWDTSTTPVDDVAWAREQVRDRLGVDLPTALVGHSLGGRAALVAGGQDGVRTVVALNPWVYPHDGVRLAGRDVLVVHGTEDRIALPERAEAVARRAAAQTRTGFVAVEGAKHAMLRQGPVFERAAADFVRGTLLGTAPDRLVDPVRRVLAGEAWVSTA